MYGISASANVGTRRASLRASAFVGTHTCTRVGVCGGVYAFVCEHARERACVRACELVFVEFSGDGDGQPAAATAETACRSSDSPDGLASTGSLPPPSLLYPTCLVFAVPETVTVSLQPTCLPAAPRLTNWPYAPTTRAGSTVTVESDCHGAVPGHGQPP